MEVIPFPSDHHGEFLYVGRFCGSGDLIAAGGSGTNDLKIIDRTKREVRKTSTCMKGRKGRLHSRSCGILFESLFYFYLFFFRFINFSIGSARNKLT